MSRQDKAVTERNAKALRELLKRPDNKLCADCKRNDPRWASWNLGVFLCIRCSGIHRSMGTHISKVKSVDLDAWTPPQMESIRNWGNRLANKYWEAHLKPGHIPADHKMDSFIRSKYETRRWALDGPVPSDPSVLDTDTPVAVQQTAQASATPLVQNQPTPSVPILSTRHQLLSTAHQQQPQRLLQPPTQQKPQALTVAQTVPAPQPDLFSLDFHSPTPPPSTTSPTQPAPSSRNLKQDILSLYASPTSPAQPQNQTPWSQTPVVQSPPQLQSMMGTNGVGMWGVSSGWAPIQQQQPQNIWGDSTGGLYGSRIGQQHQPSSTQPMSMDGRPQAQFGVQPQPQLFGTNDIWASSAPTTAASTSGISTSGQKDAFDEIWGGFK